MTPSQSGSGGNGHDAGLTQDMSILMVEEEVLTLCRQGQRGYNQHILRPSPTGDFTESIKGLLLFL